MRVFLFGISSLVGGANSEAMHAISLLRRYDVDVHVACFHNNGQVLKVLRDMGCVLHPFSPKLFAGEVVAAWNSPHFLSLMPTIIEHGKPELSIWLQCMTKSHNLELILHKRKMIDRFGFISEHQRRMVKPGLASFGPVHEFEGYIPFFDPEGKFHDIRFLLERSMDEFVVGRISRDDPTKYATDTWQMFRSLDVRPRRKRVVMLGVGENVTAAMGPAPLGFEVHAPGAFTSGDFYRQVHCVIHKTGGSGESYCRVVVECYASGTIFVGENDYALPELVVNGETGFLCNSSDEMIEVAKRLSSDELLRRKIALQAKDHLFNVASDPERCWPAWERILA